MTTVIIAQCCAWFFAGVFLGPFLVALFRDWQGRRRMRRALGNLRAIGNVETANRVEEHWERILKEGRHG